MLQIIEFISEILCNYLVNNLNILTDIYLMVEIEKIITFVVIVIGVLYSTGSIHVIDYGNIGVYKRGGALLAKWTQPGLHFLIPFITTYSQVQVTLQTDKVTNIPCGTSSGVMLNFENIEVVNRLKKEFAHATIKNYTITYDQTWIFSKIHHEINQFCSGHTLQQVLIEKFNELDENLKKALQIGCNQWAPGIEIIAVRVTKPKVPQSIAATFEEREVQRTKLLIKKQEQKLRKKQAQSQKKIAEIDAQTLNIIDAINNKMNLLSRNTTRQMEQIQNQILTLTAKATAESKAYRNQKLIELNKKRLIPQKQIQTILSNLKSTNKNVYEQSLSQYLGEIDKLVPSFKNIKSKEGKDVKS